MTIFMDPDGWRDESDEGPVDELRTWHDYSIVRYRYGAELVVKRDGEEIKASFGSIDLAKRWCERDHERRMRERTEKPAKSAIRGFSPNADW